MNLIKIDLDRKIAPINPGLYGSGLEHLGRGVYGGIYEPSSLLADSDGFRQDVLDALPEMPILTEVSDIRQFLYTVKPRSYFEAAA